MVSINSLMLQMLYRSPDISTRYFGSRRQCAPRVRNPGNDTSVLFGIVSPAIPPRSSADAIVVEGELR